jgi:predicted porin
LKIIRLDMKYLDESGNSLEINMKKSLLALGVLSAFTVAAHAQSSVTLYGVIDEGLNYTTTLAARTSTKWRAAILKATVGV